MSRVDALLRGATHLPNSSIAVDWDGSVARLTLGNARSQRVQITERGDHIVFESVVLSARQTRSMRTDEVASVVWERNQQTDVVAFGWDSAGRLVGRIDQLAATLNVEELWFYLEVLAQQCDRLEWLLTGEDVQ